MQLVHLVLGRPTGLLPFALRSILFGESFLTHSAYIAKELKDEIFQFAEVTARC